MLLDVLEYMVSLAGPTKSVSGIAVLMTKPRRHRGFTLSYGVLQAYYKHELLARSSPSAISWIGTIQGWLLILVGVLSGPLFGLGYFRSMLFFGNFLVVLGIMMLSLATEYWHVFLAQGLCMGLGAGLLYVPSLALVGIWFSTRRSLAMGIVTSGIAAGELW